MSKKGVSSWPGGLDPVGLTVFTKRNLLVIFLLAIGLSSLIFYLIPPGYYDRRANLLCSLSMLALMPLAFRPRLFPWLVHGAAGISAVLVVYIATESGG